MTRQPQFIKTAYNLPYNLKLLEKAKELRKKMTPADKKLWNHYLKLLKIRFLRQRPINDFIVDFYCAKLKLVIEIDGETHFTDEAKIYDRQRTLILQGYELQVIRFTNQQVFKNFEGVCEYIENFIIN